MGGDPSRHGPGRSLIDWTGRVWTCVHTDGGVDPASTISLAGFCSYCGFVVHSPRGWLRARHNRNQRVRAALMDRDGPWCVYCERPFGPDLAATLDHVVPRAAGGTGDMANLVLACEACNNLKADRLGVPRGAYVGVYADDVGLAVAI